MKLPSFRSRAIETTNTGFFAYVISRKPRKLQQKKTYRTLFNAPKQNCIRNLERFRQSSILSKKPSALFPPKPSIFRNTMIMWSEELYVVVKFPFGFTLGSHYI